MAGRVGALAAAAVFSVTPVFSQASGEDRAAAFQRGIKEGKLPAALDPLLAIPQVWTLTPDKLDAHFALPEGVAMKRNPWFQWMTANRERAGFMRKPYPNLTVDFTLFEGALPVEEVVVDFIDGKLNGINISLYNRGDSGSITTAEFDRRMKLCGQKMSALLEVRPSARKADPTQGLRSEGWTWISGKGMAILEYNPEAPKGQAEFLRLKIAPRDAKGVFAAAFRSRSAAVKLSELPRNVRRGDDGDVFIKGVPMVDQGPKGYCVVASVQRLFEYYGIPADQHQLAQAAESDAETGTSSLAIAEALGKIDYRFKTRFKIHAMSHNGGLVSVNERKMTVEKTFSEDQFLKVIRRSVDEGVPLLWSLQLGQFPEEPAISPQTAGGHMRMIIGYNDQTHRILFSDSWGAGHELKRMEFHDAYQASRGLFTMMPTVR